MFISPWPPLIELYLLIPTNRNRIRVRARWWPELLSQHFTYLIWQLCVRLYFFFVKMWRWFIFLCWPDLNVHISDTPFKDTRNFHSFVTYGGKHYANHFICFVFFQGHFWPFRPVLKQSTSLSLTNFDLSYLNLNPKFSISKSPRGGFHSKYYLLSEWSTKGHRHTVTSRAIKKKAKQHPH